MKTLLCPRVRLLFAAGSPGAHADFNFFRVTPPIR